MPVNISKITIKAAPDKVWEALTNPDLIEKWQYGSQLYTTWKVGDAIKFVTEWEGNTFEQWGTVLEYDKPVKLRYSLFAPRPDLEDKPENYFEMIYILVANAEETILQIIQEDFRPNAIQQEEQGDENPFLQALKLIAESS